MNQIEDMSETNMISLKTLFPTILAVLGKLIIWLIFTVVITLTPIIIDALIIYIFDGNLTVEQLFRNGELFIVAVAIGADAIRVLLTNDNGSFELNSAPKIVLFGVCLLLILFGSVLFAVLSIESSDSPTTSRVVNISIMMFFFTIITSISCIIVSEM